jgi:putative nucleotidyltransferase-like protein
MTARGPEAAQGGSLGTNLFELLLGDAVVSHTAAGALDDLNQWPAAIALAGEWRVLPQLRGSLQRLDLLDELDSREQLSRDISAATALTIRAVHEAKNLLQALRDRHIPHCAFKGIGLIAGLYRRPAFRTVGDLDLLAEPDRLEETRAVLGEYGFTFLSPHFSAMVHSLDRSGSLKAADLTDRELLSTTLREQMNMSNLCLVLVNSAGFEVDVHWSIGTQPPPFMSASKIIGRAEDADLLGLQVTVASPVDAILLTAHHALRAAMAPFPTIKDLCDLAQWLGELAEERWSLAEAAEAGRQARLQVPLYALWSILASVDPKPELTEGLREIDERMSPGERRQAARLASWFNDQLAGTRLNPDVMDLFQSPWKVGRMLFDRVRGSDNRAGQPHSSIQSKPWLSRAYLIARELVRPSRLAGYRAVVRAHNRYR